MKAYGRNLRAGTAQGFGYEWTGMSFRKRKATGQAAIAVGLAILLVYLILAALYANWILPLGVLLVIPLALFGTVARHHAARHGQQYLCTDRDAAAHRHVQQKRAVPGLVRTPVTGSRG